VAVLGVLLGGCGSTPSRAPVIDRLPSQQAAKPAPKLIPKPAAKEADWRPQAYTVQKGDTLFSVALEHGHDYRDVAEWNGIQPPYVIKIGQVLRLTPLGSEGAVPLKLPGIAEAKPLPAAVSTLKTEPKALKEPYTDQALARLEKSAGKPEAASQGKVEVAKAVPKPAQEKQAEETKGTDEASDDPDKVDWAWPASGKILSNFNDNGNAKGLDIAGTAGQAVAAAAAGKVVHTGTTLRGYGKLIIIKHNKSYFSVYAHSSQILVKEGQSVVRGQKIAEMGDTDADRIKLHFEIRRLGKPVDPLKYLPNDRTS
jgi:lipoprotein NlpD